MWLITNFGFFSVVEKPAQKGTGMLTVRARVKADLVTLRERYLNAMGPIEADTSTDYQYRAVAPTAHVAAAFCQAVADIDYSNFKNSVSAEQGSKRCEVYHDLWHSLWKLADEDKAKPSGAVATPVKPSPTSHLAAAFGGVVFNLGGHILLRKPTNEFDDYVGTFPKGRSAVGESPEQTARRDLPRRDLVHGVFLYEGRRRRW